MLLRPAEGSGNVVGVLHLHGPFLADVRPRREPRGEHKPVAITDLCGLVGASPGDDPAEMLTGLLELGLPGCGDPRSALGPHHDPIATRLVLPQPTTHDCCVRAA